MADRPGYLLYHGRSVKLMNGLDDLRPELRAHIETHYPAYTGAPDTFESPNDTSWTYCKLVLDARAAAEGDSLIATRTRRASIVTPEDSWLLPIMRQHLPLGGLERTDKADLHKRRLGFDDLLHRPRE